MAGCFPDPYPDELLYSLCARYSDRVRYPNHRMVMVELFGSPEVTVAKDLPSRLGHLEACLSPHSYYTLDNLINNHTLLPYFRPFLRYPNPERIRESMSGCETLIVFYVPVIMKNKTTSGEHLRFCRACLEEDTNVFGSSYWHRIHQVPGVAVCPTHALFLEKSNVKTYGHGRSRHLVLPNMDNNPTATRIDLSNETHKTMLRIAQYSAWILNAAGLDSNHELMREHCARLLADRGLASCKGPIYDIYYPRPRSPSRANGTQNQGVAKGCNTVQ
jgi:TniQ